MNEADIPLHVTKVDGITITGKGTLRSPLVAVTPSTLPGPTSFGTSPNYSQFEGDGTLVFNGTSTVYRDVDFPIIIRNTGVGIPTLTTLSGNITAPQWAVNDFNQCEGQELVHSWKEGSPFYFHVHVITNGTDTTDRYVKWEIEWVWAAIGGQLSATQLLTNGDFLIPANTPSKTHLVMSFGATTISSTIGTHIYARLKRIAATGTAPTLNPWCSMLQAHVECDTIGSRSITTK